MGLRVFYGFVSVGIVAFILGTSSRSSGNTQSQDLTPKVMAHPGGRWLVILVGIGTKLVSGGVGCFGAAPFGCREGGCRGWR